MNEMTKFMAEENVSTGEAECNRTQNSNGLNERNIM